MILKRLKNKKNIESINFSIYNELPLGVILTNHEGNIVDTNPAFLKLLGYDSKKELINTNAINLYLNTGQRNEFLEQIKNGSIKDYEFLMKKKNGENIWVSVNASTFIFKSSNYFLSFASEVTKRKLTEQKLIHNEKRFRTLFEKSIDPILLIEDGIFTDCNENTAKFLKYDSKDEIIGKTPDELSPEKQPDGQLSKTKAIKKIETALADGSNRFEWVHQTKNGENLWIDVALTVITEKGKTQIYTFWRDITVQKEAKKELQASEAKFKKLIQNLPDAIFVSEIGGKEKGKIIDVNFSAETQTGYTRNELLGMHLGEIIADSDEQEFLANEKKLLNGETIRLVEKKRRKDGSTYWVEVQITTINYGGEKVALSANRDISEIKKNEEALKESQKNISLIYDTAGVALFHIGVESDGNYRILSVNNTYLNISGRKIENVINKPIEEVLDKNSLKLAKEKYSQAIKLKKSVQWEETGTYPAGIRSGLLTITPVFNEAEKCTSLIGVVHDITDKNKMEEDLIKNESILKEAQKIAKLGYWEVDLVKNEVKWSDQLYRICHIDPKKVSPSFEEFLKIIHPDDQDLYSKKINASLKSDQEFDFEYKIIINKNRNKHLKDTWHTDFDEEGKPYRAIGAVLDITDRKIAEEKIKKSQEELEKIVIERTTDLTNSRKAAINLLQDTTIQRQRAEEALIKLEESHQEIKKLSQAVEQSTAAVVITDINGNIEYTNQTFVDHTGYSKAESIGKNPRFLKSGNTPDSVFKSLWQKITSGESWMGEFNNKKKNGDTYWESAFISPIFNDQKEIVNYVKIAQDISERKKLEEELVIALEQADQATKAKSEFLANMSHEIRTPMNAILGFSDLLSLNIKEGQAKSYLDSLKMSGKSLLTLINDILDLSKVEAGMLQLNYDFINLSQLTDEIKQIFSGKIEEKNLKLNVKIDKDLPASIYLDESRLRQVLINLTSNAIKFTEEGHINISLSFKKAKEKTNIISNKSIDLTIIVKDSGIGIPKEFHTTIFDSFTQYEGHVTKKYEGTGLGLAITQKLVTLMKGEISLVSEPGIGSTFTLTFKNTPITSEKITKGKIQNLSFDDVQFQPSLVLIVDDVQNNLMFLAGILEYAGLKTITAENGKEALDILKTKDPNLIITDIRMPVMDGVELLKSIRNNPDYKNIPIVAASASVMKESLLKIQKYDFDGVMTKPIQIPELITELLKFIPFSKSNIISPKINVKHYNFEVNPNISNLDILASLEKKCSPLWLEISERQPVRKVEKFGKLLIKIGNNMSIHMLSEYGNDILIALKSFNIEGMVKLIKLYPKLVQKIKNKSDKK